MLGTRIACPQCGKQFNTTAPVSAGDNFRCPQCLGMFNVSASNLVTDAGPSAPSLPLLPPIPPSAPRRDGSPVLLVPRTSPPPAPRSKTPLLLAAFVLMLAIGAGVGIGLKPTKNDKPIAEKKKQPEPDTPAPKQPDPVKEEAKTAQKDGGDTKGPRLDDLPPPTIEPKTEPKTEPKKEAIVRNDPPLARSSLTAEKQEEVNRAIDRGIAFLRKTQAPTGSWIAAGEHVVGLAALPALTLLECGVPHEDPVIQKALAFVRREARTVLTTYDISLAILFLDRYGDPADHRLIQTLALRLMAGQQPSGGWTYHCREVFTPEEELVFFDFLQQTRPRDPLELFDRDRNDSRMDYFVNSRGRLDGSTGRLEPPKFVKVDPGMRAGPLFGAFAPKHVGRIESTSPNARTTPLDQVKLPKTRLEDMPQKLKNLPILNPLPSNKEMPAGDGTDNSNTQFAILGVWASARRHVPMERTLAMLVKRFRTSQNQDGSWGYQYRNGGGSAGTPSMNVPGLLGLAVGHGLLAGADPSKGPDIARDPAIKAGLESLARHLESTKKGQKPTRKLGAGGLGGEGSCYFLWSVERVGVLYNLPMIGECDWYAWGVDVLLPGQGSNGSWVGVTGSTDTCLALLFLKRANLTRDLSTRVNLQQFLEKKD